MGRTGIHERERNHEEREDKGGCRALAVGIASGLMAAPAGASAPDPTNPNAACISALTKELGGIGRFLGPGFAQDAAYIKYSECAIGF